MTESTPRTVGEIADELFALHDALPEIRVPEDHYQAAELAYGWYARTWLTTKALMLLHDQGFDPEAAPMRRTLIEHALALQWIGHSPDACYDAVVHQHRSLVEKLAEKPSSATAVPRETLDALLALELDGGSEQNLLHIYDLAMEYGPNGTYTGWWQETGGSHPSWRSALPYHTEREGQHPLHELMPLVWFAARNA